MEKLAVGLRLGCVKKDAVGAAYKKFNAEATSFLRFNVLWKDLESHYDSISTSFSGQLELLRERERSLEERSVGFESRERGLRLVEEKIDECAREVTVKEVELISLRNAAEECWGLVEARSKDLEQKEKQVALAEMVLRELESEIGRRKVEVAAARDLLAEHDRKVEEKVKELTAVTESTEELNTIFDLKKGELEVVGARMAACSEEAKAMEERLSSLRSSIEERSLELEDTSGRLQVVQELLEACSTRLEEFHQNIEEKEKELRTISKSTEELCSRFELKKQELESAEARLAACSEEAARMEEVLGYLQSSIKERSIELEDRSEKLRKMENSLEACSTLVEEHNQKIREKEKELRTVRKSTEDLYSIFELKKQEFESVEARVAACSEGGTVMEEKLVPLQSMIEQSTMELVDKLRRLKMVESSLKAYTTQLNAKRSQFIFLTESVEGLSEAVEKRGQCHRDTEFVEQQRESLEAEIESHSEILASKDKDFERKLLKKFKLKQQEVARTSGARKLTPSVSEAQQPQKRKKRLSCSGVEEDGADPLKLRRSLRLERAACLASLKNTTTSPSGVIDIG